MSECRRRQNYPLHDEGIEEVRMEGRNDGWMEERNEGRNEERKVGVESRNVAFN